MKIFTALAVFVVAAVSALGQGQIIFNNRVIGQVVAPVYGINPAVSGLYRVSGNATTNGGTVDYTGFPLVSGTNFTAQLWYGPVGAPMNALQPVTSPAGTVPFRSTANTGGFIQNSVDAAILNGIPFGSMATLQMRVWYNHGGTITSWAQAISSAQFGSQYAFGFSDTFTSPVLSAPPDVPPYMVGLVSFNLQGTLVPEPSVIAFAALGLTTLLLRRRNN
jgi:hypothetical protein